MRSFFILGLSFLLVGCGSSTKAIITNEVEANSPIEVHLDLSQVTDDTASNTQLELRKAWLKG